MQPVRLTIPGEYWDSHLYEGRLYLFCRDGSLLTIDWDRLVDGLRVTESLKLARECAFKRSDYLYGPYWSLIFSDLEVRQLISRKFNKLANMQLQPSQSLFDRSVIGTQDNPLPFPHADMTIYMRNIYVASAAGVWRATASKKTKKPVSTRPERKWDGPTVSIAAGYRSLALAAGGEGLWNLKLSDYDFIESNDPTMVTSNDCDACEFMYHSVYGSSYSTGGFLAEYSREFGADSGVGHRTLESVLSDRALFEESGYSWGTRDKIYQVHNNSISVLRYSPFGDDDKKFDILAETIPIASWKGGFVTGGVAAFGAVVEYDNAIVVIPSEGDNYTIQGEPINWRVFPSSKRYQNHLHVITDDSLSVYSFNQDYFVDQESKLFGVKPVFDRRAPERTDVY